MITEKEIIEKIRSINKSIDISIEKGIDFSVLQTKRNMLSWVLGINGAEGIKRS